MEKLTDIILENVFNRLPVETALQAKRVCKTWRFLLRSKTDKVGLLFCFSYEDDNKKQLCYGDQLLYDPRIRGKTNNNKSYYDSLDKLHNGGKFVMHIDRMLGSCNGLVCFRTHNSNFLIANPLTGEFVYAPPCKSSIMQNCGPTVDDITGFGYCHSTNEYKIVRIYLDVHKEANKKYCVQVYTVDGGSAGEWRNKESINFQESIQTSPLYPEGIYANGSIHWLHHQDYMISAFDLEDETLQFLPLPILEDVKYLHDSGPNLLGPKLLGGKNLYFVDTFYDKHCTVIWAYKRTNTNGYTNGCDWKENYDDESMWHWIKEFNIEWEEQYWKSLWVFDLVAITRNDQLLLRCFTTLYYYDLKTSTLNELFDGFHVGCNMIDVIPHANSIVSMSLENYANDKRSSVGNSIVSISSEDFADSQRSSITLGRSWGRWKLQLKGSFLAILLAVFCFLFLQQRG